MRVSYIRMNETRQALLDATRTCVGQRGLATTSRDITAAAGANLAAITYHFGSKDDLVADALLQELRSWLDPTIAVLGGDGDPATRTVLAIQTLMTTFQEHEAAAPTYVQAIAQAPMLPALHAGLRTLWGELRQLLAADITAMRDLGELPAWIEPATMAAVLVAVANGLVLHVTVDPDGPSLADLSAQFAALLLAVRSPSPG
jgi:AcrR family transcriptional regulator